MSDEPSLSRRRHAPKGPVKTRDNDPMAHSHPMDPQRCRARSRSGQQCKRLAILGGTVCYYHGAAAPQVKMAAMDRLRALQHPAVDRIGKLIDQEQFPTVAYAASKDVLDRTLGKAAEIVELHQTIDITITERLLRARQRNGNGSL